MHWTKSWVLNYAQQIPHIVWLILQSQSQMLDKNKSCRDISNVTEEKKIPNEKQSFHGKLLLTPEIRMR